MLGDETSRQALQLSVRTTDITLKGLSNIFLIALKKLHEQAEYLNPQKRLKKIIRGNSGVLHAELAKQQLNKFSKLAKKYNVQFAVEPHPNEKDVVTLIFKSDKGNNIELAMKEFASRELNGEKESIKNKLDKAKSIAAEKASEALPTKKRELSL